MAEPPTVAALWLDADQDYGLAINDGGSWVLLEARYGRKLTDDEIAGLDHAQWHAHPDDQTARMLDHISELIEKKSNAGVRFPWM